jgi:hypothetical protein
MSASLLSRVRRLERRGGPCPLCAGRRPRVIVDDPEDVERPPPSGSDQSAALCPLCGKPPPVVVMRIVYDPDFFHNKDRLDDLAAWGAERWG